MLSIFRKYINTQYGTREVFVNVMCSIFGAVIGVFNSQLLIESILLPTIILGLLIVLVVNLKIYEVLDGLSCVFKIGSKANPFRDCIAAVMGATDDITVFGPHFYAPKQIQEKESAKKRSKGKSLNTKAHDDYLIDGVEETIKRHGKSERGNFTYLRVVQLDDITRISDGKIRDIDIGNEGLASHLQRVLNERRNDSLKISVIGREVVRSFPSTLVVDNRWVFFSLPKNENPGKIALTLVVGFEDKTGDFPRLMRKVILNFSQDSEVPINKILSAPYANSEPAGDYI
jgi:hypothetical protein